ncbi:hypothetical protein FBQ99_12715 [Chloroflexi bacterium CFX2]|nr:hypothetical protein [Chloroflexi bacterium CFX2]
MKFRKSLWLVMLTLAAVVLSSCNIGASPAPTEDPGIIQTQAFGLVLTQAADQQTQTAAAAPPTPLPTSTPTPTLSVTITVGILPTTSLLGGSPTPFAFNTQQPGLTPQLLVTPSLVGTLGAVGTVTTKNGCNDGYLVSESQPYDGKTILLATEFTKSWEFINTGTCVWDEGYTFAYVEQFSTGPRYGKDYIIPKDGPFTKPGEYRTFTVTLKAPKVPGEYTWYYKLKDDAGNFFGSLVWVTIKSVTG